VLIPYDPAAVALARRYAVEVCGGLSAQRRGDIALVVSELVTNAIRHGQAPLTLSVRPVADSADGAVRVEVVDANPTLLGPLAPPAQIATGHRGLLLVDRLCRRWGSERAGSGKIVWCEL
jgi:anti-sigma regulatory factor (Ser/Thr protein kinase)